MEIKHIFKKYRKHAKLMLIIICIGIFLGAVFYLLPSRHIASGTLFVNRTVSKDTGFFTYEGYYGQQTAISYANSVFALLSGTDLKKIILENNGIPTTNAKMKWLDRILRFRKTGPQVISVTVKGSTDEEAKRLWISMANAIVSITSDLNKKGDPNLSVSLVSMQPVVGTAYKSPVIFLVVSLTLSFVVGSFIIAVKQYLKG